MSEKTLARRESQALLTRRNRPPTFGSTRPPFTRNVLPAGNAEKQWLLDGKELGRWLQSSLPETAATAQNVG